MSYGWGQTLIWYPTPSSQSLLTFSSLRTLWILCSSLKLQTHTYSHWFLGPSESEAQPAKATSAVRRVMPGIELGLSQITALGEEVWPWRWAQGRDRVLTQEELGMLAWGR